MIAIRRCRWAVNRAWIKSDYEPTGVCNICSGKHVVKFAGSKSIGAEITDYHRSDHPMQLRAQRVTEELCGLDGNPDGASELGCRLLQSPSACFSAPLYGQDVCFGGCGSRYPRICPPERKP